MMVTIRYAQNVYQVQISKAKPGLYWHWVKQRINWAKIIWIGKFQDSTKNNTRNSKKKKLKKSIIRSGFFFSWITVLSPGNQLHVPCLFLYFKNILKKI
jgi:hypothetical protein